MGRASRARAERRATGSGFRKKPWIYGGGIELDFNEDEWAEMCRFQDAVNSTGEQLSMNQICRQAIFMTIQRAYQEAAEKAKQDQADGQHGGLGVEAPTEELQGGREVHGDVAADSTPASTSQDASGDALANSQDSTSTGG